LSEREVRARGAVEGERHTLGRGRGWGIQGADELLGPSGRPEKNGRVRLAIGRREE